MPTPFLDVQNVSKSFGERTLFRNISFSIAEGQHVGLIAQNGTGKTTLLSMLTGKESMDSGSIIFRNDIKVGYLRQDPYFEEGTTVTQACFTDNNPTTESQLKAKQILTQLRIHDMQQPMSQLSGGQQKRVALAQVLISNPDMLILDEPTNHLDVDAKAELKRALQAYKGSILMVCHEPDFYEGLATDVWDCSQWTTRL